MKDKITAMALAMAASLPSWGADLRTTAFPPLSPGLDVPVSNRGFRAPLNQERKKGLKVFGSTQVDMNRKRSFVNYHSKEFQLERLCPIFREDEISIIPDIHMMNGGRIIRTTAIIMHTG